MTRLQSKNVSLILNCRLNFAFQAEGRTENWETSLKKKREKKIKVRRFSLSFIGNTLQTG